MYIYAWFSWSQCAGQRLVQYSPDPVVTVVILARHSLLSLLPYIPDFHYCHHGLLPVISHHTHLSILLWL